MSSKAAVADRYQRQILALVKEPGNDQCADCRARNPRWASWDQGVFLCVQCASMHRKLGTHISKIKSLTLDTWSREQVDNMRSLGNVRVNSFLNPDERRHPPPAADSGDERNSELERFIRNKYEYRVFAAEAGNLDSESAPAPASTSTSTSRYAPPLGPPPPPLRVTTDMTAASSTLSPTSPPPPAYGQAAFDPTGPPLPARPAAPSASSPFAPSPSAASQQQQQQQQQPQRINSPFANLMTTASPPPVLSPGPVLPPRVAAITAAGPRSVHFPEAPATYIPSPPDSDDDDDEEEEEAGDDEGTSSRPPLRKSSTLRPPAKGILRRRPNGGDEILVDWAALTSSAVDYGDDDNEDVPLGQLGALGARGAQVGMMGVATMPNYPGAPVGQTQYQTMYGTNQGQAHGQASGQGWVAHQHLAVPYGAPGGQSTGGGVPIAASPHQQMPAVAPLQPQYTGSAKGYLHQQRQHHQQQQQQQQQQMPAVTPLQPQFTGSAKGYLHQQRQQQQQQSQGGDGGMDSFQQMFQPPNSNSNPTHGAPPAAAIDTNPFRSHLFHRNQYSPSPQPQYQQPTQTQQPQQQQQQFQAQAHGQQQQQPAGSANDIWADLNFLDLGDSSGPPSGANGTAQSSNGQHPAPAPLRPQLTGFVPSSSFGQQLARETATSSPAPYANGSSNHQQQQQQPPLLTLQIPSNGLGSHSGSSSPAPFAHSPAIGGGGGAGPLQSHSHSPMNGSPAPLRPQLTGFVPSSSFGQELARTSGYNGGGTVSTSTNANSGSGGGSSGTMHAPQPLKPQRTGFVPSSRFGLELAKESGAGGASDTYGFASGPSTPNGAAANEPAPFDLSPTTPVAPQQQQQQSRPGMDAFSNFSSSFNAALPPSQQQQFAQQQFSQPPGAPQKTNPFLRPQLTGYMPQQQRQQLPPQPMQPQLTGFAGGGGGGQPRQTNPFLAFAGAGGQQQQQQGWR